MTKSLWKKNFTSCPIPANKIIHKAVIVFLLLSVILITAFIKPGNAKLLTCQFKHLTGYSCPTCGLTRSFHAFSHLNFQESFRFHLMGPAMYLVILYFLIKISFEIASRKEIILKINPWVPKIFLIFFFCTLLCFWIIRFINEINAGS